MVDDIITAEQWVQRTRPHATPVQSLWLAVLTEAVCLATGARAAAGNSKLDKSHTRQEAAEWIATDGEEIGSFRWVCDALGLNAEWIRREIGHAQPTRLRQVVNYLHNAGSLGRKAVA